MAGWFSTDGSLLEAWAQMTPENNLVILIAILTDTICVLVNTGRCYEVLYSDTFSTFLRQCLYS